MPASRISCCNAHPRHPVLTYPSPSPLDMTDTDWITPRKFTSITHADDRYLALADDGTAWEDYGNGWVQLDPLPTREVQG